MRKAMLPNYVRVRLLTDRFRHEGLGVGALGYVIEVHGPDAYEVEFSDPQGITMAQVVARASDLQLCERPLSGENGPAHALGPRDLEEPQ